MLAVIGMKGVFNLFEIQEWNKLTMLIFSDNYLSIRHLILEKI